MGLVKRTYVDGETVITADNLNDIQDEIIQNASDISTKGTYSKPSGGIPSTDMTTDVQTSLGKADTAYQKPSGGIPSTDLTSAVQTSLGKADTAYQKPSGGIPGTDLASAVQTSLGKADTALQSSDIDSTLTVAGKAADAKKTGDEISGVKNTLNHKADVIYDTASGDIASFPDGADGLPVKDLTVGIEPVQAGTGDPSPTNVRPISGWTGCNVTRTGKNLFSGAIKAYLTGNDTIGYKVIYGNKGVCFACRVVPNQTYTITAKKKNNLNRFRIILFKDYPEDDATYFAPSEVKQLIMDTSLPSDRTYTFDTYGDNADYNYVFLCVGNDRVTFDATAQAQLELGSTATVYEPYSDTTLPISWQSSAGTVYGGTLDVTTGVLTVDRASALIKDLSTNYYVSGDMHYIYSDVSSKYIPSASDIEHPLLFSALPYGGGTYAGSFVDLHCYQSTNNTIYLVDNSLDSNAEFVAKYGDERIVWYLATPQTYQLTPAEVNTLLGQNNIWADTGDSTVEYPADTKLYIQKINTPTDDDMVADANIASGKYFIINNNLYLSTTAILAGDPIKPGTNCTLTNLAAALNALNS